MPHTQLFHTRSTVALMAILLITALTWAQAPAPVNDEQGPPPPPPPGQGQGPGGPQGQGGPQGGPGHRPPPPPPERGAMHMPPGMWWTNPEMIQKLNLTTDQQKKIADTFQQFRLKLIDSDAAVRKEEAIMDPLVQSEAPEDAKILAQIDKVAQARAELEKTNARMLLAIRHALTPEQWKSLLRSDVRMLRGGPDGGPGSGPPPRRPQQD